MLASESRTSAAVVQARRAHRLDPLAVDPLFTLALVEQQQGQASAAGDPRQAVRLQPQNYATSYELGLMELNVLGRSDQAAAVVQAGADTQPHDRTRATSSAPPSPRRHALNGSPDGAACPSAARPRPAPMVD